MDRVQIIEAAMGAASGRGRLSIGQDTTSRMLAESDADGQDVVVKAFDEIEDI